MESPNIKPEWFDPEWRDAEGRDAMGRDDEGRYRDGSYERLTDAARQWIVSHPYYSLIDHRRECTEVIGRALHLAIAEGVNYIDVTHLDEAAKQGTL